MLRPCIGAAVGRITPKKFICVIVFLTGTALASNAEIIPVPRERPPVLEDQTSKIESERSPCQLRLSEIAEFKPEPPITGPGECTATDVVDVNAVLLPGNQRVVFSPVVTLQCSMAEVVSHWIRDDVAPPRKSLGCDCVGIETLNLSYRSFNGISAGPFSRARSCQRWTCAHSHSTAKHLPRYAIVARSDDVSDAHAKVNAARITILALRPGAVRRTAHGHKENPAARTKIASYL